MQPEDIDRIVEVIGTDEKRSTEFAVLVAHRLTVSAREFYLLREPNAHDQEALGLINELMHRALGYALRDPQFDTRSVGELLEVLVDRAGSQPYAKMVIEAANGAARTMTR